jgi:hypothetical protein
MLPPSRKLFFDVIFIVLYKEGKNTVQKNKEAFDQYKFLSTKISLMKRINIP